MPQDYSRHRTPPNTHKTPPADLAAITADGRHMKTTRTTLRAGPTPLETRTATHFADRKRTELRTAGEYRADPKPFTTDAKFSRPTLAATVFNSINVQNALAALERLPTAGETFHFVTASTFRPDVTTRRREREATGVHYVNQRPAVECQASSGNFRTIEMR